MTEWEALGEARPGQSSLSAGALRYRAWAQSWSSAALAARSVLPSNMESPHIFLHRRDFANHIQQLVTILSPRRMTLLMIKDVTLKEDACQLRRNR